MKASKIEELLAGCSPAVKRLANDARARIMSIVPHATERLRGGWSLIGYNAPHYFVFIVPEADRLRIGFEWGALLPDPSHLLEGNAKQVRYTTISSVEELHTPARESLLEIAAAMPPKPRDHGRGNSNRDPSNSCDALQTFLIPVRYCVIRSHGRTGQRKKEVQI
jgi:hypothetical protein